MASDVAFPDARLVGLTLEQREAVVSPARRMLVRATAGSGKTHVLTLRIEHRISIGDVDADHVLAMTFTRKAADQLRQRLRRHDVREVRAGTFHRVALTIVNQFRRDHDLVPVVIEPARRKLVTALAAQMRADGVLKIEEWQLPRIEMEIGWALSQGLTGATYVKRAQRGRRAGPLPPPTFADLLDRYVGLCRARGVLDFDLLLSDATQILRDDAPSLAAFRHRTRTLFVDEAQDMNPLQFDLLRQMGGDDPDLFLVGDPNQSIYGFNGANPALLADVLSTWPDTVVLDLTRNHRSTARIVEVANTLLEAGVAGITPARAGGDIPLIRGVETDADEAEKVAQWLRSQRQPGSPWRSMAVLARTNAQLDLVEAALARAEVPHERLGGDHAPASDLEGPERRGAPSEPAADAVALTTIHRAKGLEWQHVAVIGMAEGQLPHFTATSESDLAEERRLAYVALSRAERTLLLTWSKGRDDPRRAPRTASRFLEPIERVVRAQTRAESPLTGADRAARIASIRERLRQSAPQVASPPSGSRRPSS